MLCSKCFRNIENGNFVEKNGTKFCKDCAVDYSFSEVISKALHGEKVEKEVIAKCYGCSKFIHNTDSPRKFLKNFGFEFYFTTGETEEIVLCEKCYQKKLVEQKKWRISKWILFFSTGSSLTLLFLLFYQEKIEELWKKHPIKIVFLTISLITIFLTLLITYIFQNSIDKRKKKNKLLKVK